MKWLNRSLLYGPYLCLCRNEKSFKKTLKHLKIKKGERPSFLKSNMSDATVHFFEQNNKLTAVVCLGDTSKASRVEVVGLLIHESVHIYQQWIASIGEKSPGSEVEAYVIQAISQTLIEAYDE